NTVLDHERCELIARNERNASLFGKMPSTGREIRRGDEYTFLGVTNSKRSLEVLNFGLPHGALPALRLHVHFFEPETIERNHSIDTAVAGSSDAIKILATA